MAKEKKMKLDDKGLTEEICKNAELIVNTSKMMLTKVFPYFTRMIYELQVIESTALDTMGVDNQWRLYYNPVFTSTLKRDQVMGVLYHELSHMLRNHSQRKGDRIHILWNIAADMEINDDVFREKVEFSLAQKTRVQEFEIIDDKDGKWLSPWFPEAIDAKPGLSAEEYYMMLMDKVDKKEIIIHGINCDCDKEGDGEDGDGEGKGKGKGKGKCKKCRGMSDIGGSISDGDAREHEDGKDKDGDSVPGYSNVEKEIAKQEAAEKARDHAKNAGSVPGSILRWTDNVLRPSKTDWRKVLATKVKRAVSHLRGKYDYTYSRLGRRDGGEFLFPGMVKPDVEVAVGLDTSGSISPVDIGVMLSETDKILKTCDVSNIRAVCCDAAIHSDVSIRNVKDMKYEVKGGGGTDMALLINYLDTKASGKKVPSCAIIFTDGYTGWPSAQPSFNCIIVLVGTYTSRTEIPKWATVIEIDPDDLKKKHENKGF